MAKIPLHSLPPLREGVTACDQQVPDLLGFLRLNRHGCARLLTCLPRGGLRSRSWPAVSLRDGHRSLSGTLECERRGFAAGLRYADAHQTLNTPWFTDRTPK